MNRVAHLLASPDLTVVPRTWVEPLTDEEWLEYAVFLLAARTEPGWHVVTTRDRVLGTLHVEASQVRVVAR